MGLVYSLQFSDMLFAGWNRHTDSYYCVKIHEMSEILEKSLALFARKFCAHQALTYKVWTEIHYFSSKEPKAP